MSNLDFQIQKLSYELAQALDDTEINKLLGVLANDGVYAMWMFSLDKVKSYKEKWVDVIVKLLEFLFDNDFLEKFEEECNEKDSLKSEIVNLKNEIDNLESNIKEDKCKENKDDQDCKQMQDELIKKKQAIKVKQQRIKEIETYKIITDRFIELSENLSNLLFFKEAMEQLLTYARYHKKAL